ncbi:sarcosine oxidase subunit alpha [soil metagenome]
MTVSHDAMRLGVQPGEVLDRSRRLHFTWNGADHWGYDGDTIASALAADGVRVFSRSFKYHRPRGLLTASFHEPGCMLQVGDEPNVRGAHRRLRDDMAVSAQNAWPSLRFDVKAANQLVARFLTSGFYYKTFMAPRQLWPAYERVLRRFAAGGVAPTDPPDTRYDHRFAHADVLVAGGGPAGMAAAIAAAEAGARVMLVEEEPALGGYLRWGDAEQLAAAAQLRSAVAAAGVEVLTDAVVTGRYDGNWVAVLQRGQAGDSGVRASVSERLIKVRVGTLVVAAGLIERPYVFAGNDLPGVVLSTGVRRLINLYAVRPGAAAVVLTANADGDAAIADLERVGVEVRAVVDARTGGDIVRARGRGGLQAVECADGRTIECDLLVTATGWTAPTSLCNMAGARPVYHGRAARFLPGDLPDDVLATGGLVGDGTLAQLIDHGRAVGRRAARRTTNGAARRSAAAADDTDGHSDVPQLPVDPHPALFRARTHGFVDFSEDVTSKELIGAVAEGYDSIELAKRYTTATMGPVQGKLETVNTVAVVAEATGSDIARTGTTVWRPPYAPVSLGALAGRIHEPVRRSPLHPWHVEHDAAPLVAGAWIRPDHYGDPAGEARNVRETVGIIDVTPLGKLDLRGPDVPQLLNQVYVNKWSKLAVGAVRYGVMCAEDGVVLDDGVTGRLDTDHYIMTTTSSGALAVWEWIENWLQTERPQWQVHVTPVTTAYASMNVAGPRSRELLARLVDVELDPEAFGYMRVRTATIAGVADCFMWRIGFTGELSYELHVPSGYGRHVWDSVLAAGADLGVRVFGVEAQRILRLEKGHAIVGQDTDGLTQAYGADLAWAIKLDKGDFAGKPELVWQRSRDDHEQLVGLQPVDGTVVPPEASQLVEGAATIVGRITSSRMSPTLGRAVCLGYVAPHLAAAGTLVSVQLPDGTRIPARVMSTLAHVDPEGARLRAEPPWDPAASAAIADPVVARSPIPATGPADIVDGWQVATHQTRAALRVADHTPLPKTWVRAPRDGSLAASLSARGRAERTDDGSLVCGVGPGEWLVVEAAPGGEGAADTRGRLRDLASVGDEMVTIIDQTHGRALVRLTGDLGPQVLAKICAIDLHDDVTPDGTALRTQVAAVTTDIVRDDVEGTCSYLLGCEWSSGQYLFDEVLIAGAEFDIVVDGFHP